MTSPSDLSPAAHPCTAVRTARGLSGLPVRTRCAGTGRTPSQHKPTVSVQAICRASTVIRMTFGVGDCGECVLRLHNASQYANHPHKDAGLPLCDANIFALTCQPVPCNAHAQAQAGAILSKNSLCGPTAETDPAWQASQRYAGALMGPGHARCSASGARAITWYPLAHGPRLFSQPWRAYAIANLEILRSQTSAASPAGGERIFLSAGARDGGQLAGRAREVRRTSKAARSEGLHGARGTAASGLSFDLSPAPNHNGLVRPVVRAESQSISSASRAVRRSCSRGAPFPQCGAVTQQQRTAGGGMSSSLPSRPASNFQQQVGV